MKVAMLGHKAIPSTKGGIETVLTALCPLLAERGAQVTCYNRSAPPCTVSIGSGKNGGKAFPPNISVSAKKCSCGTPTR